MVLSSRDALFMLILTISWSSAVERKRRERRPVLQDIPPLLKPMFRNGPPLLKPFVVQNQGPASTAVASPSTGFLQGVGTFLYSPFFPQTFLVDFARYMATILPVLIPAGVMFGLSIIDSSYKALDLVNNPDQEGE